MFQQATCTKRKCFCSCSLFIFLHHCLPFCASNWINSPFLMAANDKPELEGRLMWYWDHQARTRGGRKGEIIPLEGAENPPSVISYQLYILSTNSLWHGSSHGTGILLFTQTNWGITCFRWDLDYCLLFGTPVSWATPVVGASPVWKIPHVKIENSPLPLAGWWNLCSI